MTSEDAWLDAATTAILHALHRRPQSERDVLDQLASHELVQVFAAEDRTTARTAARDHEEN